MLASSADMYDTYSAIEEAEKVKGGSQGVPVYE